MSSATSRFVPADSVEMEEQFLDPSLPLDNSIATRYVDYEGVEFIEDDLLPPDGGDVAAGSALIEDDIVVHNETVDDDLTVTEFEDFQEAGQNSLTRRKQATIVQCDICGVFLKHPSKIVAHMRTHTGEKPFECSICGTKFSQRTPMLNHVRRHMGQLPFECNYGCGKKFVNNAQRNAHELRHLGAKRAGPPRPHLKPPKRVICTKLLSKADGRTQQSEEERSTMVDFAPPVGQIETPISAAASKRLDEIIESVISGVPVKKRKKRPSKAPMLVQCQVCGLMLKHASKIRAHIRTHTGDKPFICVFCDEQFSTSGILSMHIKRKHTQGERPYACTWDCGKRFVSLSTRNEHERVVHAGTKRYECNVTGCFRMFTRRYYLMLHRQREHGLLYKPVYDPEEILTAEKEADRELRLEKQRENLSCQYGQSDQILLDPTTNMLVHVSEDGMVLEPEMDQHTFMQGEFVEEAEDVALAELMRSAGSEAAPSTSSSESGDNKANLYLSQQAKLDPEPSRNEVEASPPDKEVDGNNGEEMPSFACKDGKAKYKETKKEKGPKGRWVNILKKKLPARTTSMLGQEQRFS